jgi:ribosome maturation factor RimP
MEPMEGRERELFDLLEPIVASQGVDLVEVVLGSAPGGRLVRVVIHSPDGVSHGDCARVTRALGSALDEESGFEGRYSLEVSSPGTSRVLKEEREFDVFRGLPVWVRLEDGAERSGTCAGTRSGEGVALRAEDGTESVIPWTSVSKARLAVRRGVGGKGK